MSVNDLLAVKDLPATLQSPNVFQPRIIIDNQSLNDPSLSEFAKIFLYLQKIAGGMPRRDNTFVTDVLPGGTLEFPTAEYVAVPDNNPGGPVVHNNVVYPYVGFAPIIGCNIYRNPASPQFNSSASIIPPQISFNPADVTIETPPVPVLIPVVSSPPVIPPSEVVTTVTAPEPQNINEPIPLTETEKLKAFIAERNALIVTTPV